MNWTQMIASEKYLPKHKIENEALNQRFDLEENWIEKRTGIKTRYYAKDETIEEMAIKVVEKLLNKVQIPKEKIGQIIVATTSSRLLMPGISFKIQKALGIESCMCMDLLAGCSGYINGFDIIQKNIMLGEIEYGIVVGAEKLSDFTEQEDVGTAILLADGAGATLLGKSETKKEYACKIESLIEGQESLTCNSNVDEKIYMDGKKIYKFAVTKTVENIKKLLEKNGETLENIKYIVPHQSNKKILESICERLGVPISKMYINLDRVGNTFNSSIPIALAEMEEKKLLNNLNLNEGEDLNEGEGKKEKILLIGYGGGLNLGSILIG